MLDPERSRPASRVVGVTASTHPDALLQDERGTSAGKIELDHTGGQDGLDQIGRRVQPVAEGAREGLAEVVDQP